MRDVPLSQTPAIERPADPPPTGRTTRRWGVWGSYRDAPFVNTLRALLESTSVRWMPTSVDSLSSDDPSVVEIAGILGRLRQQSPTFLNLTRNLASQHEPTPTHHFTKLSVLAEASTPIRILPTQPVQSGSVLEQGTIELMFQGEGLGPGVLVIPLQGKDLKVPKGIWSWRPEGVACLRAILNAEGGSEGLLRGGDGLVTSDPMTPTPSWPTKDLSSIVWKHPVLVWDITSLLEQTTDCSLNGCGSTSQSDDHDDELTLTSCGRCGSPTYCGSGHTLNDYDSLCGVCFSLLSPFLSDAKSICSSCRKPNGRGSPPLKCEGCGLRCHSHCARSSGWSTTTHPRCPLVMCTPPHLHDELTSMTNPEQSRCRKCRQPTGSLAGTSQCPMCGRDCCGSCNTVTNGLSEPCSKCTTRCKHCKNITKRCEKCTT